MLRSHKDDRSVRSYVWIIRAVWGTGRLRDRVAGRQKLRSASPSTARQVSPQTEPDRDSKPLDSMSSYGGQANPRRREPLKSSPALLVKAELRTKVTSKGGGSNDVETNWTRGTGVPMRVSPQEKGPQMATTQGNQKEKHPRDK